MSNLVLLSFFLSCCLLPVRSSGASSIKYNDEFIIRCVENECRDVAGFKAPLGRNTEPYQVPVAQDLVAFITRLLAYFYFAAEPLNGIYEINMAPVDDHAFSSPSYFAYSVSLESGLVYLVRKLRDEPAEKDFDEIKKKILIDYPKYQKSLTFEKINWDRQLAERYFKENPDDSHYERRTLGLLLQNIVDTDLFRSKMRKWESRCKTQPVPYCGYLDEMKEMEERYFYSYIRIGEEEHFPDINTILLEDLTVDFKYDMIYVFPKHNPLKKELMRKKDLIILGTPNESVDIPEGEKFRIKGCHLSFLWLIGLSKTRNICEIVDSKGTESSVSENDLKSYLGLKKTKILGMGL